MDRKIESEPPTRDLSGVWRFDTEDSSSDSPVNEYKNLVISLAPHGQFATQYLSSGQAPSSPGQNTNGDQGTWLCDWNNDGYRSVVLQGHKAGEQDFCIWRDNAPHLLGLEVGDPDDGDLVFFRRVGDAKEANVPRFRYLHAILVVFGLGVFFSGPWCIWLKLAKSPLAFPGPGWMHHAGSWLLASLAGGCVFPMMSLLGLAMLDPDNLDYGSPLGWIFAMVILVIFGVIAGAMGWALGRGCDRVYDWTRGKKRQKPSVA